MKLPHNVLSVMQKLDTAGYEVFAVGGCVRDALLGKTPKDFDLTTSATPEEIKRVFPRTVDTGIKHGTVTVLYKGGAFEITTYRIDGEYTDNRRPENVTFSLELREDLRRRDFTVNALAYHPKTSYVDYYGGIADLRAKILRGVGDPAARFTEDGLRMLRAVRFCAQLGFEIEPATLSAIREKAYLLKNISAERVHIEFTKIIESPHPEVFALLCGTKLLKYFSENLQIYLEKNLDNIIQNLTRVKNLAAFFMYSEKPEVFLKEFKSSKKIRITTCMLCKNVNMKLPETPAETRQYLSKFGVSNLRDILIFKSGILKEDITDALVMIETILSRKECFTIETLAVNGADLATVGVHGIDTGRALSYLLSRVIENPRYNNKNKLLDLVFEFRCRK
ncbi:polynucleotide adenylyltransferase [Clostridia bacterium]|nr:polynucleotide adenylyltransferase [Clostridia bacterium]